MEERSLTFLKRLLATPAPSGDEIAAARIWREEAGSFADEVRADVRGNSFAVLHGGPTRILLAGHIDEIGLMVSYIDDDGFLSLVGIGGWDPQVLVGQRVRLIGRHGDVIGVIGKKPIHLMKAEDRERASKMQDLWLDIGVASRAEAEEQVRIGTVGVIDAAPLDFPHGRVVSRSIDNRIGAFTVLEALRLLAADRPFATVAAVATAHEETSFAGAYTAAFGFDPLAAIAVDVTFATDHPTAERKVHGYVKLGSGPNLARGGSASPVIFEMLLAAAEAHNIPYTVSASPGSSGTDADAINRSRAGIASGVVSIPNRYMHSPNEMIQLSDVEHAAHLIAAFVRSVDAATDFIPR
ncbi:MAG TPA: M42 family metallopeptidase [Roseiflexaceae bacterium]|nr:M42 family metallopeptidase [Roseiflexaceae bacterium]HMP40632.1 M42 family metallopeptidase [Roseiflexaceae bacterium]